ncbi:MAG: hypothetical protein AAB632_02480 [Patescibacteria group bacterium]
MPNKDDSLNTADRLDCETITDAEIEDWIVATRKVLIVLDDEDKSAYNRVYQDFLFDLQRLLDAGRITDIDYEETLESL